LHLRLSSFNKKIIFGNGFRKKGQVTDDQKKINKINKKKTKYIIPYLVLISDKYVRWLYASSFVRDSLNRAKNESVVSNDCLSTPPRSASTAKTSRVSRCNKVRANICLLAVLYDIAKYRNLLLLIWDPKNVMCAWKDWIILLKKLHVVYHEI